MFVRYPDVSPNDQVPTQFTDPDFEIEAQLPPLESIISKDVFRKLKQKEKKWYEVVNGKHRITIIDNAVVIVVTCKKAVGLVQFFTGKKNVDSIVSNPAVSIKHR